MYRTLTILLLFLAFVGCQGSVEVGSNGPDLGSSSNNGKSDSQNSETPSVCGDGLVAGAETCDGACPASCDDGSSCTTDSLSGDASTCDAACSSADITACIPGDGCCPDVCDATTDADCSATCGDGVVDAGETCDGNCPSACDDGDACTTGRLTGSPERCNVQCSTTAITACVDADGCCPSGCVSATDSDCGAVCGNGIVEGTELCDGDCPADCNDSVVCTRDVMRGTAATCDVACEHTTITACMGGDGCCPATCHELNDSDCDPVCGNDVVETGESCDGACPDCNDGVACTADVLSGSAATCDVSCANTAITMCIDGDGCCAPGCNSTNDDDCNAACGNGVVEGGETCDPIADCPTSCNDGNACTRDNLVGAAQTCDAVCLHPAITMCIDADGCCPNGCNANNDDDCMAVCGNGATETGESCDPMSSCPQTVADCDDNDACTGQTYSGSAAQCTAMCNYNDVTACIGGDGCCPPSCDIGNDSDCTAVCGNGVVEPGETCDPVADCPTDCDDQEACTIDTLTGAAASCDAMCEYADVTACVDGDDCCPMACDETNDDDCIAMCGNGVVETGETCDPIADCPTAGDCDDMDDCTLDGYVGAAMTCDAECTYTTITMCVDGDACCPPGCTNANDDDCPIVIDCRDPSTWPSGWVTLETAIFNETNARRTSAQTCNGNPMPAQPAFTLDARLTESARCHALDMATNNFFSHTGSDGSSPFQRMIVAGYNWSTAAENIAAGNNTATAIVNQWMNSPSGHCEAIMSPSYDDIGIGYAFDQSAQYDHYSVQNFGAQ